MKTLLFFVLLFFSATYSQTYEINRKIAATILPQGIRWQSLSSNGFSYNFPTTLSQISGSNPAALVFFDTLAVGLSYQYNSNINEAYLADFGYINSYIGLPQSLAFVYPWNESLTIGFSASQKYNSILDFGEMDITTIENPQGTGETFSSKRQTNIYAFSAIAAYDISRFLSGVSFAIRVNYDYFRMKDKIWHLETNASGSSPSFATGVNYRIETGHGQIELAGYYETGIDISGDLEYKGVNLIQTLDPDPNNGSFQTPIINPSTWKAVAELPNRFHFGVNFRSATDIFLMELSYADWESAGLFKNSLDFSTSYGHPFSDQLLIFYGIFIINHKFKSKYLYSENKFNSKFLTVGANTLFNGFNIDIVIADSHLFSHKWHKQTIFKFAVGKAF
ncbi:MAG: hypothetical protein D8M58_14835 [Calditrichaeota bacterium]|nr:MAG: hypothetical protein DWQ03_16075 [Calditrichota bacterium]MBL1206679.1 hypothetical protein [Calditrichota bacterium]NOG46506.1 hypothetical protein [Calditrichota bacterium]